MKKLLILILLLISFVRLSPNVYAVDDIDFEDLFTNHQSVMLVIHPTTGEIYYANQAAADFYGYPLETLLNMNIDQINTLTPEELATERLKALEEERNFFIFKHKLSNGDIRIVHVYSYPVDINGETYLYSIVIDQSTFVIAQNRNNTLIITGITFLILSTIVTSLLALKIFKKKREIAEINETLLESEQRFKMLHDASFGGLLIHDQGLILECNQALSDITGYSTEELISSNSLTLIAPEYHDIVINKINTGYQMPYEAFGIRKNGEKYPLKLEARNLPYHGKQVRVVEFRDITELKKQEDLKLTIENQWSKLIQEMPLGFNVRELIFDDYGKPIDYIFISINDNYESITGLKREHIIGKRATEVMPEIEDSWMYNYAQVVQEKKTLVIEDYSRALGRYFRVVAYPYKGNQFVIVAEDITKRKNYEEQLITKEIEKSRIISNLPGVSYTCRFDDSWTMVFMSDACETLTGYKPSELIENQKISFAELIVPKFRTYLVEKWVEARSHNLPCNIEYQIIKKDGTKVWIWEKGRAYIQDDKWYIEGFLMDITERKVNEERIKYASNHDFLTGLPNRKYFEEKLIELDQKQYYPLLIAMIDFDGLKLINDAYGHDIGDEALKKVSNTLNDSVRENDFVARIGGDEFIILCPHTTLDEFEKIKDSILSNINFINVEDMRFSLSIGYDVKYDSSTDMSNALKNAENNMYSNKILHGQSARNETIMTLFETLKEKYDEEKLHSDRVSQYCKQMGEKLNLTKDQIKELEFAGLMHDIGKITIPDSILDKPGKLTEEEWVIMKKHTINGYHILRSADKYSRLAEYALTHHERWDGKGYPNGLKGEDIPLFSRIISISDAYEAMTADRPYRKALDTKVAIEELCKCAGSQFDKALVDIFVKEVIQV